MNNGIKPMIDKERPYLTGLGITLILTGAMVLLDPYIHAGFLAGYVLIIASFSMIGFGIWRKSLAGLLRGVISLTFVFIGVFIFAFLTYLPLETRVGIGLTAAGTLWLLVPTIFWVAKKGLAWWGLLPAAIFLPMGLSLWGNKVDPFFLILVTGTSLGVAFIVWSTGSHIFGLAIPGCLVLGASLGIYLGWHDLEHINGLTETGVMLVWFAFGWGLIIILGRIILNKLIWWPIIPGGVLALVGWGLYIGGDPISAIGFIGNTGSIALIIIGAYLLLLRSGVQR